MLVREAVPTKSMLAGPLNLIDEDCRDGTSELISGWKQNARVMTTLEDEEDEKEDKVLAEKKTEKEKKDEEEDDDATSVASIDTKKSSNRKKTLQDKYAKNKQKKKVLSIVNEVSSFIS
ncbi:hypothetical protein WR25_17797 [Diploscapter pachys]|uniref:Uncharacterized protein n=1 Tax=Diploscapter pachys TaxID=2018661 RepID=A0A2A2KMJ2_9BILA|nr:hypothetical protein WR25_17797 [Diploscapter pachys]